VVDSGADGDFHAAAVLTPDGGCSGSVGP
jgi:hypothetical protein